MYTNTTMHLSSFHLLSLPLNDHLSICLACSVAFLSWFDSHFKGIIMDSVRDWILENKLASIGTLWATAVGGSLLYTGVRSPLKTSLRLIHARMHAQALTLAVLSSAAAIHYYEKKQEVQQEKIY